MTAAHSRGRFPFSRYAWIGGARTAAAALHYLLETEPADMNPQLVASNRTNIAFLSPEVSSTETEKPQAKTVDPADHRGLRKVAARVIIGLLVRLASGTGLHGHGG